MEREHRESSRPEILHHIDMTLIDGEAALLSLLDDVSGLPVKPPSLYLDLEGIKLGRHGYLSILSIFVRPQNKVYLIDVHVLGSAAFLTTNSSAVSLKSILESPSIPKVIFDVRNDSDALFSHYQVSVDGIKDLQLMELATRRGPRDFVAGLVKCVENDSPITPTAKAGWRRTKEVARQLYDPEKGGRYEIFNERPLRPEIEDYCAGDVVQLPGLFDVYDAKLRPSRGGGAFWRVQVREATRDRIKLSQHPAYDGQRRPRSVVLGMSGILPKLRKNGMRTSCSIYGLVI